MNALNKSPFLLLAMIGLALTGCGNKEAAPAPQASAVRSNEVPWATPRNYEVNGQIDLDALTQTVREYVRWKGQVPADISDLVMSGFMSSLPKPPAGKRIVIARFGIAYSVMLADH